MEKFEQMLAQMAESIRSDSNWLIETQRRQGREYEQDLAKAEDMVRRLLNLITTERQRFSGYREAGETPPPEQVRGPRDRALAEMRQRTNSGEQPNGRAAAAT
jgi:hypothetical protein